MEIVLAGSYEQYQDYLRKEMKTHHQAVYIRNVSDLLGMRKPEKVVRVGTWANNDAYYEPLFIDVLTNIMRRE